MRKTYVAEVINGVPQALREIQMPDALPLGVLLKVEDARIYLSIDFLVYYGRKYSAELRGEVKPQSDPLEKFKVPRKRKAEAISKKKKRPTTSGG